MSDDSIPEFIVDDAGSDDPAVEFKVTYSVAGEKTSEVFQALPPSQVPYVWVLDYFAAGIGDQVAQSAATLTFFDRVLTVDDHPRFVRLLEDRTVAVTRKTLQQIVIYLVTRYSEVDPTRARSAGQKRSRGGRSNTGGGSTGRASAKASTSR